MIFKIVVTCMIWISATTFTFAATNTFSDVPPKHWAYNAVTTLKSNGIIEGYADGNFKGTRNITRYETVALLDKYIKSHFNISTDKAVTFSDVPQKHWASESVNFIASIGIINGYADKTFRGNRNMSRYEMAQMIYNVLKLNSDITQNYSNPFKDVSENHWAIDAVTALSANGIVEGYADGTFRGNRNVTRYEAAVMIAKAIEYYNQRN